MFCDRCGAGLPASSKFCPQCGSALAAVPSHTVVSPAPPVRLPSQQAANAATNACPHCDLPNLFDTDTCVCGYVFRFRARPPATPSLNSRPGWRSPARLAKWVVALLLICALLDGVAVLSTMSQIELLERAQRGQFVDNAAATANDSRQAFVGGVQLIALLVTAVCFLKWLHVAYKNLPAISKWKPTFTPGWAIGSWFTPVLFFFRPYQIVRETWWVSSHPTEADTAAPDFTPAAPAVIKAWWAVYLVSHFVGQATFRMGMNAETLPALMAMSQLQIAADLIGILSAGLALQVVRLISASQDNAAKARLSMVPDDNVAGFESHAELN
jgi:hypothetical protein